MRPPHAFSPNKNPVPRSKSIGTSYAEIYFGMKPFPTWDDEKAKAVVRVLVLLELIAITPVHHRGKAHSARFSGFLRTINICICLDCLWDRAVDLVSVRCPPFHRGMLCSSMDLRVSWNHTIRATF
jgi:hypothetical protein